MVVQHNMSAMTANRYYTNNNSALGKSMEKLSSGLAINRAGDNAAGLAVSEKMRAQISGLTQASKNAQDGISMVQTFEGALSETDSILQRMRTLAVQSSNGSYQSDVDRDAIQLEFNQLNAELNEIADTDYNGVIVLNGGRMTDGTKANDASKLSELPTLSSPTDSKDVKFEYSGATGSTGGEAIEGTASTEAIKAGVEVDYKASVYDSEGNPTDLYMKSGTAKAYLEDGTEVTVGDYYSDAAHTAGKECGFASGNTKINADGSEVGGAITATTIGAVTATESYALDDSKTLYKGDDDKFYEDDGSGNFTEVTDFSGYTKDGKAVTNDGGTLKTTDTPAATSTTDYTGSVTVGGNEIKIAEDGTFSSDDASLTVTGDVASGTLTVDDGSGTAVTYSITNDTEGKKLTFTNDADDTDTAESTYTVEESDNNGSTVSVSNTYGQGSRDFTYANSITLQVGARSKDAVEFTFSYSANGLGELKADMDASARGLGTDQLDLTSQKSANYAIDKIDNAINKVSMIRGTFGAIQNRLEHKISNLDTNAENLTAAESRIRDTQMDQEMMKFTSAQILSQASQSMLAQANSLPQGVLQLLG